MSGKVYTPEREVFIFQDGDRDRWCEEVNQLSTALVDGVKISGNRRVAGKLSVFTNQDLVNLILLYATPRTFNYTKEDLPYTLLLNPFPLKKLDFFDSVTTFEKSMSPFLKGVSKMFHYQTGRYFSKLLSTSFVSIDAVDFLKYSFESLLEGVKRGADQVDCTCQVCLVMISFQAHTGLILRPESFQYHFFEDSRAQVEFVNRFVEDPSFCAVFVKTSTKGWAAEHFFAHSGQWVYEGDDDQVLESNVRIVTNEEFETLVHL